MRREIWILSVGMINSPKLPPPLVYGTGGKVGGTGSISLVFSSVRKPSLLLLRFCARMRIRRGRRRRDRRDFSLQSEINEMPTERGGFADDLEVCLKRYWLTLSRNRANLSPA